MDMSAYPDANTHTIRFALSAEALDLQCNKVTTYSLPGITVPYNTLCPSEPVQIAKPPPMSNLVRAICGLPKQRDVGNHVKSLHKNFSALPLITSTLTLDPAAPHEQLLLRISDWFLTLTRVASKYFLTHHDNPDFTDVSDFFLKEFQTIGDVTAITFDVPAVAPGTTSTDTGGLQVQTQVTSVKGLNQRNLTTVPMRLVEPTNLHNLGNTSFDSFFHWLQEKTRKNVHKNPFYAPPGLIFTALFEVQHFFAIQQHIETLPTHIQQKMQTFILPAVNMCRPFHTVHNLMKALRHSSLTKYLNHLNRIAEYSTYLAMTYQDPIRIIGKTQVLECIQNGTLSSDILQETLHYMRTTRKSSPSYLLNLHFAYAFFYKHFTGHTLQDNLNYNLTVNSVRRMDWDQDNSSDILTPPQIDALINILKDDPGKYGHMGYLVEFGAAMITRTSELVSQAKFKDVKYETYLINHQPQKFITLTLHKAKNARIPKTKMVQLGPDEILHAAKAFEFLKSHAKDQINGFIAINAQGKHLTLYHFNKLFKAAIQELINEFPELKDKKITWYSIRSGMLVALYQAGFTESEIKAISLHSHNSRVLNTHYLDKIAKLRNTAYQAFLTTFKTHTTLAPSASHTHQLHKDIKAEMQATLDQLLQDFIKRAQTENLVALKLAGSHLPPIDSQYLAKRCPGTLSSVSSPRTPTDEYSSDASTESDTVLPTSPTNKTNTSTPTTQQRRTTPIKRITKSLATPKWPLSSYPWDDIKNDLTVPDDIFRGILRDCEEEIERFESWDKNVSAEAREQEFTQLADKYSARIGTDARAALSLAWEQMYGEEPPL